MGWDDALLRRRRRVRMTRVVIVGVVGMSEIRMVAVVRETNISTGYGRFFLLFSEDMSACLVTSWCYGIGFGFNHRLSY